MIPVWQNSWRADLNWLWNERRTDSQLESWGPQQLVLLTRGANKALWIKDHNFDNILGLPNILYMPFLSPTTIWLKFFLPGCPLSTWSFSKILSKIQSKYHLYSLALSASISLFGQTQMFLAHGSLSIINRTTRGRSWLCLAHEPSFVWGHPFFSDALQRHHHMFLISTHQHKPHSVEEHNKGWKAELWYSKEELRGCASKWNNPPELKTHLNLTPESQCFCRESLCIYSFPPFHCIFSCG